MSLWEQFWIEERHPGNASIHYSGSSLVKQQSPPRRAVLDLPCSSFG